MIHIDYQPGSHGNYLEFVCNKFLSGVSSSSHSPFNVNGAAHNKGYVGDTEFKAWHYSDYRGHRTVLNNSKIISIRITPDDLLPLTAIALLRAGDYGYDNNVLEEQTFAKLRDTHTECLRTLTNAFFVNQVRDSYNAVKDVTWPEVNTIDDFNKLPQWIQDECINVHNLYLLDLEGDSCPRWVLREFFKAGFKDIAINGFIRVQSDCMHYNSTNQVLDFPYSCFYNTTDFTHHIKNVAHWLGRSFSATSEFISLHEEFLARQPYVNIKQHSDSLVQQVISGVCMKMPELELLEESYVSAALEQYYNKELPSGPGAWPSTTQELRAYLE